MLVAKGYPDLGWNPIEGERYLSFLRFAVFCNGMSAFIIGARGQWSRHLWRSAGSPCFVLFVSHVPHQQLVVAMCCERQRGSNKAETSY